MGFFIIFCFSGDFFFSLLFALIANLHEPIKEVKPWRNIPHWLIAAQLKAGGSSSMEYKDQSYRQRLLATILFSNKIRLRTGNCRFPCCVFAKNLQNRSAFSGHKARAYIFSRIPLSTMKNGLMEQQSWYSRDLSSSKELPE